MRKGRHCKFGQEVGSVRKDKGYAYVGIAGKTVAVHRVAFALMGKPVPKEVDHKNGDKADNRWSNLRPATRSQNIFNSRRESRALPKGVLWRKDRGKYIAVIGLGSKRSKRLGTFDSVSAANAAYQVAERKIHGEFAYGRRKRKAKRTSEVRSIH